MSTTLFPLVLVLCASAVDSPPSPLPALPPGASPVVVLKSAEPEQVFAALVRLVDQHVDGDIPALAGVLHAPERRRYVTEIAPWWGAREVSTWELAQRILYRRDAVAVAASLAPLLVAADRGVRLRALTVLVIGHGQQHAAAVMAALRPQLIQAALRDVDAEVRCQALSVIAVLGQAASPLAPEIMAHLFASRPADLAAWREAMDKARSLAAADPGLSALVGWLQATARVHTAPANCRTEALRLHSILAGAGAAHQDLARELLADHEAEVVVAGFRELAMEAQGRAWLAGRDWPSSAQRAHLATGLARAIRTRVWIRRAVWQFSEIPSAIARNDEVLDGLTLLERLAADPDVEVRIAVAEELGDWFPETMAVVAKLLRPLCADAVVKVRCAAIGGLGGLCCTCYDRQRGYEDSWRDPALGILPELRAALLDPDPVIQRAACDAVDEMGGGHDRQAHVAIRIGAALVFLAGKALR